MKVFYIREGVFGSYRKGAAAQTTADKVEAGKKIAKKAIIDNMVAVELPKLLMHALPSAIKKYDQHLQQLGMMRTVMHDFGIIRLTLDSFKPGHASSQSPDSITRALNSTGIWVERYDNSIDIKIPIVAEGYNTFFLGDNISKMHFIEFRKILAAEMAPEIDEIEAYMLNAGFKLGIKFYLTTPSLSGANNDGWQHMKEIHELVITTSTPFIEEQAELDQGNTRNSSEAFSEFIQRQKFNAFGMFTQLLDYIKTPSIHWNSNANAKIMTMEQIADELGQLCIVLKPESVKFAIRAEGQLKACRGSYVVKADKLDSVASLVASMPENSNLTLMFVYDRFQDYTDLREDDSLLSDKLCKEIFGMSHADVINRVLNELDAKQTKNDLAEGLICKKAYVTCVDITVSGGALESSQIEVKVAKMVGKLDRTKSRGGSSSVSQSGWSSVSTVACKWAR